MIFQPPKSNNTGNQSCGEHEQINDAKHQHCGAVVAQSLEDRVHAHRDERRDQKHDSGEHAA